MCLIVAVMLLAAVNGSRHSDYYMLLRWVVVAVSTWLAARVWTRMNPGMAIAPILIGVVFNPIYPVWLDRQTWQVIDVLACSAMVIYAFVEMPERKPATEGAAATSGGEQNGSHATGLRPGLPVQPAAPSNHEQGRSVTNPARETLLHNTDNLLRHLHASGFVYSWQRAGEGYLAHTIADRAPVYYHYTQMTGWATGFATVIDTVAGEPVQQLLCSAIVNDGKTNPQMLQDLVGYYDALVMVGALQSHQPGPDGGVTIVSRTGYTNTIHGEYMRMYARGGLTAVFVEAGILAADLRERWTPPPTRG